MFFHEADPAAAIGAARRLVPQLETARLMAPTWTPARFGTVPRLYIEATLDRTVPLATQRDMQRLTPGAAVVTLETDHAPQLSMAAELAHALVQWCSAASRGEQISIPAAPCVNIDSAREDYSLRVPR